MTTCSVATSCLHPSDGWVADALRPGWHCCRQDEPKGRPGAGVGVDPQAAAMRLDDRAADRQSHADAVRLGGEECVEDLGGLLFRHADTGVGDRDQQLVGRGLLRRDRQLAASIECFIASMPLSMRFINTCCNCTGSAITCGRPGVSTVRMAIE